MDASNAPAPAPKRRRALLAALIALALVAFALVGVLAWVTSESALTRALAEISQRSGGTLTFEGASGSLLSEMRARRVEYRDAHVHVVAEDVAITWSPSALWSRQVRIDGLGAQRIDVTLQPSDAPASAPESLALPLDVTVAHASVAKLTFASGEALRRFDGIAFAYSGGATLHRFTDVAIASEWGRLDGEASLAAQAPYGLRGALRLRGSDKLMQVAANVTLGGSLTGVDLRFAARALEATAIGGATLAPLAANPLVAATVDAHDVDLARLDRAWPTTRLDANVEARLQTDGRFAGTASATNREPGPVDADRIPLAGASARFSLSPSRLELDELVADFGPGGRARGHGSIDLASSSTLPPSEWDLAVRELDLARLYRPAIQTRLNGSVRARVERGIQHVEAQLAQGDRALAFVATIAGESIDLTRFRARAGNGDAAGHAKLDLRGARRFVIDATATRFDPSRFFATPRASLDGIVDATGELRSPWHAEGSVTLQPTSRYAGLVVSGTARGAISARAISNASVDAKIGDASIRANGSFGRPSDSLAFELDVPRLATLAPIVGSRWPDGLTGSWRARGTITGDPNAPGGDLTGRAEHLRYDTYTLAALDVHASIAGAGGGAASLSERRIAVAFEATDVQTPDRRFAKASLSLDGTLARHIATIGVTGEDLDATARLDGGFAPTSSASSPVWNGTLAAFDNRGAYATHLTAPARLAWSRDRVELGDATIAIADGTFHVVAFNWRDGRLDTRGAFTGVPAAAIARLAGQTLPMRSTLVVGGDWDVNATPRLTGSVHVRRERGDLYAGTGVLSAGEIAAGLQTLELGATIANDTVDANATMRASALGNATATLRIGNVAGARAGSIPPDAPIAATLVADIASLAPLQPLLGTSAIVDGRIAVDARAKGTRRDVALSGTLAASDVRIAAPQYGIHWTNGRVRARLEGGALALEELSLDGGDGRFSASGTLVAFRREGAPQSSEPTTSVTWQADRFRAMNRPDMRLVVDGRGTLGATQGRLLLKGELAAREGRFEIPRATPYKLGPDVVVAGVRREPTAERFHNVPLAVDLDVDLGNRLGVSGSGLDARLAGRVHVATDAAHALTARGRIRTVSGTYYAFGQQLTIQRGELIFDGPIDNPALDVVAVRRNLPVEAGVQVTGSASLPHVVLISDPPVSDGEKLSWLVLGQGLDRTSGADAAALQAAAATLFGDNSAPIGTTLARQIGLDEIALRSSSNASTTASSSPLGGQVLAVGKRLSDKVYIIYEQGLSVANNALKIEYVLTRNLTLRGEAGTVSGVGIYYQRSFE